MEDLKFKLDVFEGPLDLLLKLIAKNKVDIYDIPISLIFDQYMEYIDKMRQMDMDTAGEFIVMASELMLIKSRMMLPNVAEDAEDPRLSLTDALIEYKKIKLAAQYFDEQFNVYGGRFIKETELIEADMQLLPHDAEMLVRAFSRISARIGNASDAETETQKSMNDLIRRHIVPIPAKIIGIMRYLYKNGRTDFDTLMLSSQSHSELIAMFEALLELLKGSRLILDEEYSDGKSCIILYLTLNTERANKNG